MTSRLRPGLTGLDRPQQVGVAKTLPVRCIELEHVIVYTCIRVCVQCSLTRDPNVQRQAESVKTDL